MKGLTQVEMVVHWMRQSTMNAIVKELDKLVKQSASKNPQKADQAAVALYEITELFKKASNNAPLP